MLGLNETIHELANSVCWRGHVLRRDDGHVMKRALNFDIEGEMKKRKQKNRWKQVDEERMKVGLRREYGVCRSKWIVDIKLIARLVEVNLVTHLM